VAKSEAELSAALKEVRGRIPPMATSDPVALTAHLGEILAQAQAR